MSWLCSAGGVAAVPGPEPAESEEQARPAQREARAWRAQPAEQTDLVVQSAAVVRASPVVPVATLALAVQAARLAPEQEREEQEEQAAQVPPGQEVREACLDSARRAPRPSTKAIRRVRPGSSA